MMKKLAIFTLVMLSVFNLTPWSACHSLKDDFHFSKYKIALQLDDAIHNDVNIPLFIIRFFHNKINFYFLDVARYSLLLSDLGFLINLISIIGLVGTVLGIVYLAREKGGRIYLWLVIVTLLIINFIEIVIHPKMLFLLKLSIMSLPYYFLSYFGYWSLFKQCKRRRVFFVFFMVLIVVWLTIWWQTTMLRKELFNFCT